MAAGSEAANVEVRNRAQQSPLASQREVEAGQAQAQQEGKEGRFAKWFPMGAKEVFDQWVCLNERDLSRAKADSLVVGRPLSNGDRTPRSLLHSVSSKTADTYANRLCACIRRSFTNRRFRTCRAFGGTCHDEQYKRPLRPTKMELRDGGTFRSRARIERIFG